MIQDTYKKLGGLGLGLSLLALCAGCSAEDPMSGQDTAEVFLQPAFHVNGVETRSIVSGIATTEGEGKIHQVKLFVTKENGYTFISIVLPVKSVAKSELSKNAFEPVI